MRILLTALLTLIGVTAYAQATRPYRVPGRALIRCPFTSSLVCEGKTAALTRGSTAWYVDDNGAVQSASSNTARITSSGILLETAKTNYWTNNADASAWTDILTPVVTTGTWDGPFSGATDGDTINDDNAAGVEGKSISVSSVSTGYWTASCYFQQGTLTTAQLAIATNGTGSTTCSFTGLSETTQRKYCTANIGGAATTITGKVFPGDGVNATTGSVKVVGCQIEKARFPSSPIVTAASAVARSGDSLTLAFDPRTTDVAYAMDVTPEWSTAETTVSTPILIDNGDGGTHDDELIAVDVQSLGTGVLSYTTNPDGNEVDSSAQTWTSGTTYKVGGYITGGTLYVVRNGTPIGSYALSASPTNRSGTYFIGVANDATGGGLQADAWIRNFTIGVNP